MFLETGFVSSCAKYFDRTKYVKDFILIKNLWIFNHIAFIIYNTILLFFA